MFFMIISVIIVSVASRDPSYRTHHTLDLTQLFIVSPAFTPHTRSTLDGTNFSVARLRPPPPMLFSGEIACNLTLFAWIPLRCGLLAYSSRGYEA